MWIRRRSVYKTACCFHRGSWRRADSGACCVVNLPGGKSSPEDLFNVIKSAIRIVRKESERRRLYTKFKYIKSTRRFINGNVYINIAALTRDGIDREELARVIGDAAMTVPERHVLYADATRIRLDSTVGLGCASRVTGLIQSEAAMF